MALPDSLITSALLGTDKAPFSPETVLNETTMQSLQHESPEAKLLLSVATLTLRQQAGYAALTCSLPLPEPAPEETQRLCSASSMRHLHLILTGTHGSCLKEWLMVAHQANRRVSPEMVPNLLLMGLRYQHMRPYLLSVIGKRALWLALEINNQNWKWVFDTPDNFVDMAVDFDRIAERVPIKALKEKRLDEILAQMNQWFKKRFLWSDELTEAFLISVEKVQKPNWSAESWTQYYVNQLTPYGYFFPLHQFDEIQRRIKAAPGFEKNIDVLIENLRVIYNFRREMIEALNTDED